MALGTESPARRPRRTLLKVTSVVALVAVLTGVAVVAQGFDVKQLPVDDGAVWALQNGDGNRYARINTDLGEIDTVKTVRSPSTLAQSAEGILLFAQNNEKVVGVSPALPANFGEDAADYSSTPAGTRTVAASGGYLGYLGDSGSVFAGMLAGGVETAPVAVDPYADDEVAEGEEPRVYRSSAIAVTADGILYSYSSVERSVLSYDIASARVRATETVTEGPTSAAPQLTVVGDTWVLVEANGESFWTGAGGAKHPADLAENFVVQAPSGQSDAFLAADDTGLFSFALAGAERTRLVGSDGAQLGIPAAPTALGDVLYAAWLPRIGDGGTLWSSAGGAEKATAEKAKAESALSYAGASLGADPSPVFQSSGSRLILNDTKSGWVWTIPRGALVASSQDWSLGVDEQEQRPAEVEEASEVLEPKPPVAVADTFGVRAGQLVSLPLLLNDHDPNDDVLTIVPESISGLPADFDTVRLTEQAQLAAVQLSPTASGSATFSYAVTDGTRDDGLNSATASVTLTVVDGSINSAPVWCGTPGCLREWPSAEVLPGGTVSIPVLPGWVDPEGDAIFVSRVENRSGVGSVSSTPSGTVVYQHPNAAAQEALTVSIAVLVSDIHGATSEKLLSILVTPTPRLTLEPFALVTTAGEQLSVSPAAHVRGAAGPVRVVSATIPGTGDGTAISITRGGASFDFRAERPGNYAVNMTVADAASELVSLVRITVLPREASTLATSPVTVFVRPKADTSVDVFTAVSNPGGGVLLLSEALPRPQTGAQLDVDIVGQSLLRVRGTTADQQPGLIGTVAYTISDGTGTAALTAQGEATVYLLPAAVPQAPIAIDDAIVVRAGAQIDIPILENDVAPDGNVVVLNPDSIVNDAGAGLAFASGPTLRYLAPEQPGRYELRYGVYVAGSPELVDTATVRIEVLAAGENRAPLPRILTGRVLAGETILVPFDSFGVDPDGDEVILDRVLTQPGSGTATLSDKGDAISYTSVKGFKGAIEFEYRVRDARGDTGTSLVRIGVLDQQSDPSPITFSDYIEVRAGSDSKVVVSPTANDIDPGGQKLKLTSVLPDAVAGSDEYAALEAHLGEVADEQVTITAGAEPGLMTFVYTVENARGDSGMGLIVVKVVRESVPDHPLVSDTLLSLEEREKFPQGIDVVTGKVSWASGSVSDLSLTLYGKPNGISVSGWKIRGAVPDAGLLLPFALTGTNFSGDEVTSYGFLRIPPKSAIVLALKHGGVAQEVAEEKSITFDLESLVALPAGESLELSAEGLRSSGQRSEAKCALAGGTKVSYSAGKNSPWTDSCTVPVRLAGQDDYTQLVVPITVIPADPQPELLPSSLTLSPGADPITWDLAQMTGWQGREDWKSLVYATAYAGDQFTVTQNGAILTIAAKDAATPGRENAVTVSVSSHPKTPASTLSLKVGPAPSELPKGGTVAKECSQASGSNCVIEVIGAPGEVNLFKGTPLIVTSVAPGSGCVGVSFVVEGPRSVRASWTNDAAGGSCQASFVVKDAQGKTSAAERNGSVTVDLQGFPKAPNSISQVSYGDGTLSLVVDPGPAAAAYPALGGFTITRDGGKVSSCSAAGVCEPIRGLENGKKAVYEARSFNAVGDSRAAVSTTAWAYKVPGMGAVTAKPVYAAAVTSLVAGSVAVEIANTDPNTRAYLVNDQSYDSSHGASTTLALTLPVGAATVTVTPLSRHELPSGPPPVVDSTVVPVTVAGLPSVSSVTATATSTSISLQAVAEVNNSVAPVTKRSIAWISAEPNCTALPSGELKVTGSVVSEEELISGLQKHRNYNTKVCFSNGFGVAQMPGETLFTWDKPAAPAADAYSYAMAGSGGKYTVAGDPTPKAGVTPPADFVANFARPAAEIYGAAPEIDVRYCTESDATRCSDWTRVKPAVANQAWQVDVSVLINAPDCASWVAGGTLQPVVAGKGTTAAVAVVTGATYKVPNASGGEDEVVATDNKVPAGATKATNITWKLTWLGGAAGYAAHTGTIPALNCTPLITP